MIREYIYKTVGDCSITLDCHLPDTPVERALPILIWFHGGGLLQGERKGLAHHLLSGVVQHQFCLVSVDYRLAPQVNVDQIVQDCLDALHYVRTEVISSLNESNQVVQAQNIAVSGGSAGGYLALLVALRSDDLRACLAVYPITDPLGQFFTHPQPTLPYDLEALRDYIDPTSKVMTGNPPGHPRDTMYFYMMHEANLAALLGLPSSQKKDYDFIISKEIQHRSVSGPCPIYIVHGNKDKFVHIDQSYEIRDALKEKNIYHVFEEVDGADHLFDKQPSVSMSSMYSFLRAQWSVLSSQESSDVEIESIEAASTTGTTTDADSESGSDTTSALSLDSYDSTEDAEEQWAQQLHELTLVLNLVLLPLVGKYMGRQFAFWGWGKYMTWRYSVDIVQNKGVQRATGLVVAGLG